MSDDYENVSCYSCGFPLVANVCDFDQMHFCRDCYADFENEKSAYPVFLAPTNDENERQEAIVPERDWTKY